MNPSIRLAGTFAAISLALSSSTRESKNSHYGGGACVITAPNDSHEFCVFDQYESRIPLFPVSESAITFIGRATNRQGYLSTDHTHIYTETTLQVEQVLRKRRLFRLPPNLTVIADQIGGEILLPSGQLLRDGTRSGFMGRPSIGSRCVFFVNYDPKHDELYIRNAYELRDGQVFKLNEEGSPGQLLLSISQEELILQLIKQGK